MNKGNIWEIMVGTLVIIILILILFAEFWLPILNDPSIPYSSIADIFIPLIIGAITIGVVIWVKFFQRTKGETLEARFETRNVKIGLCLGSLTNTGTRIIGRSEYCPFNEPQLHSMFDFSAGSILNGDIETLIGPFPMKSTLQEEMHYISLGFLVTNRTQDPVDLKNYLKEGGIIGIFLFYFTEQIDSSILLRKELITNSLISATNNITQLSDLIPEELIHIEEDIQFLSLF